MFNPTWRIHTYTNTNTTATTLWASTILQWNDQTFCQSRDRIATAEVWAARLRSCLHLHQNVFDFLSIPFYVNDTMIENNINNIKKYMGYLGKNMYRNTSVYCVTRYMVYIFKLVKINISTRSYRPKPPRIFNHKNSDIIGFCTVKVLKSKSYEFEVGIKLFQF